MTFLMDENGQSIVEYALILGLIAIAAVVVLVVLGQRVTNTVGKADNGVKQAEEAGK